MLSWADRFPSGHAPHTLVLLARPIPSGRVAPLLLGISLAFPLPAQGVGGAWGTYRAFDGSAAGDNLGLAVAGIGDLNGDGYDDLLLGRPGADPGGRTNAGSCSVHSGLDGALLLQIDGLEAGARFGSSAAPAGDVDGDGVPDLLVGAPTASPNGLAGAGSAFVHSGATGAPLWRFDGAATQDRLGNAVAGAGDVDADGTPDLVVAAWWADPGGASLAGSAFVYSGSTGQQLHRFDGSALGDTLGGAVAGVGDLDGDGHDDVAVGAHNADPGGLFSAGSVFVHSGASGQLLLRLDGNNADDWFGLALTAAGDLDGDGVGDLAVGAENASPGGVHKAGALRAHSGATGLLLFSVDGTTANGFLGHAVAGIDDLSGDGVPDLAVAQDGFPAGGQADTGRVLVLSGTDGSLLFESTGASGGDRFGSSLAAAGDQNGDGRPEVAVGADQADPGGLGEAGSATVLAWFPGMTADAASFSAAAGGTVQLNIDFPVEEAGARYALLGSLAGTGPTTIAGIQVPLTSDALFGLMSSGNAPSVFQNAYGVLDAAGDAAPRLVVPAGFGAAFVGLTLRLAAVSYTPPAAGRLASVAVAVSILP